MTKSIYFYFDFISPYSYLAHNKIKIIKKQKNINFQYMPVLVGGLHSLQGISSPTFIKAKLNHMISDCDIIAKKYNFNFLWNSKFPLNSLSLMRGYLFINPSFRELYLDIIFDAYWKKNLDISNEKILITLLESCNINSNNFLKGIRDQKIKDELKHFTKNAHDKEIFGTPTFVVDNKIFWGQDRLEYALDEYDK